MTSPSVLSVDLCPAGAAFPHVPQEVQPAVVEHHLSAVVEARLAEVVGRLRASWLAGPALLWGDVHSIREVARDEFDKRVAATLAGGLFQFSKLLAGFEVLLLQLQERGVVREQTLLGLEQLLQKGGWPST